MPTFITITDWDYTWFVCKAVLLAAFFMQGSK